MIAMTTQTYFRNTALLVAATIGLAACEEGQGFDLFKPKAETEAASTAQVATASGEVIERDVEAPDIFSVNEDALWDGRPSLGGVWVAYPGVRDPERVIIRNDSTGKSVVGALFRRERENPGPRIQVSSDAAVALGMLAGAPVKLSVVALRKEVVEPILPPAEVDTELPADADPAVLPDAGEIEATPLDPIAAASAAIDRAAQAPVTTAAAPDLPRVAPAAVTRQSSPAIDAVPLPRPAVVRSKLDTPFVQAGLFADRPAAEKAADALRAGGVLPTLRETETGGVVKYRVIAGPATTDDESKALLASVQALGFSDAYTVTN